MKILVRIIIIIIIIIIINNNNNNNNPAYFSLFINRYCIIYK